MDYRLILGDCLDVLKTIESESIDAIFSDPPYPYIEREYGYWTWEEWFPMMREVIHQSKRVLKSYGSAVFIFQPNSEHVGKMRLWLWDFLLWSAKEWNLIQDVYWWNLSTLPTVHCNRQNKLMRPSIKLCLWLGSPDCFRNQQEVLWGESIRNSEIRAEGNNLEYGPSGYSKRKQRMGQAALDRGGVTPFNLIPIANTDSTSSAGAFQHGAGTSLKLTKWWLKYITKPDGLVLDMFSGTGTTGVAAKNLGMSYIGIERVEKYHSIAQYRLDLSGNKISKLARKELVNNISITELLF